MEDPRLAKLLQMQTSFHTDKGADLLGIVNAINTNVSHQIIKFENTKVEYPSLVLSIIDDDLTCI